jgi:hypothetical protein
MGYPTVSAPYGFKPVNLQGGRVYSGSTRMVPIANAYGTAIYNGDVVGLAGGSLVIGAYVASSGAQSATAGAAVGVFVGTEYSSTGGPIYGKNRYQYWAASTATNDAVGYVVDDPLAYFRAAVIAQPITTISNTGLVIGYMSQSFVGTNATIVAGNGGSTTTGDSLAGVSGTIVTGTNAVNGSTRNTAAELFRIIQLVPDTAVTVTATATVAASSTTVTLNSVAGISPGMQIITSLPSTGGAPGAYNTVITVNSVANTLTVASAVVINTGGTSVSFVGYPEVIVGWNPTLHSYNIATGV